MIPGRGHRKPNQRIWVCAYTDGKSEYYEIRTVCEEVPTGYQNLWHKEYPLGTGTADLIYSDLDTLNVHMDMLREYAQDVESNSEKIFDTARFWLNESPLFAPLAAAMERLNLNPNMAELEKMAESYQSLQKQMAFVAEHCLVVDETTDMTARYLNMQVKNRTQMPILRYGSVQLEVVRRGGNIPYPYDNLLDSIFSGTEIDPGEYFATEVLHTESPQDLMAFLLSRYLRENLRYRTCKYCNRYFGLTSNYKAEYCDRLVGATDKTCKEIGSLRLYEKRQMENPAIREYKRSYKAHNARIRYGLMTREEFSRWSKEARQKRDACVDGKLPLEEFVAWLDSDKQT